MLFVQSFIRHNFSIFHFIPLFFREIKEFTSELWAISEVDFSNVQINKSSVFWAKAEKT